MKTLFITVLLLLTGCNQEEQSTLVDDGLNIEVETPQINEDDEFLDLLDSLLDLSELRPVGQADKGFVMIPNDWLNFQDVAGGTDLQFSDVVGWNIVTLNIIDLGEMNLSTLEVAEATYHFLQDGGGVSVNMSGAVTIDGLSGYRFTVYYPTSGKELTTWILERTDGLLQYISIEGSPSDMEKLEYLVQSTFSQTPIE